VPTDHLNFTIFLPLFAAGAIPESLGNLVNLRELNLYTNELEGHFFSFFGVVSAHWPFVFFINRSHMKHSRDEHEWPFNLSL
jgi:hypothetical protein